MRLSARDAIIRSWLRAPEPLVDLDEVLREAPHLRVVEAQIPDQLFDLVLRLVDLQIPEERVQVIAVTAESEDH